MNSDCGTVPLHWLVRRFQTSYNQSPEMSGRFQHKDNILFFFKSPNVSKKHLEVCSGSLLRRKDIFLRRQDILWDGLSRSLCVSWTWWWWILISNESEGLKELHCQTEHRWSQFDWINSQTCEITSWWRTAGLNINYLWCDSFKWYYPISLLSSFRWRWFHSQIYEAWSGLTPHSHVELQQLLIRNCSRDEFRLRMLNSRRGPAASTGSTCAQ